MILLRNGDREGAIADWSRGIRLEPKLLDLYAKNEAVADDEAADELKAIILERQKEADEPKSRGDADKVSGALAKFTDEDPCFKSGRDAATKELVIHGLGDMHLRTVLSRMERQRAS